MNTAPRAVDYLVAVALVLVTAAATVAALTRDPVRQAVALSALGLCLSLLFVAVQAPDVALSQLAVGSAVTPLLILLTVRKVRRLPREDRAPASSDGPSPGGLSSDGSSPGGPSPGGPSSGGPAAQDRRPGTGGEGR